MPARLDFCGIAFFVLQFKANNLLNQISFFHFTFSRKTGRKQYVPKQNWLSSIKVGRQANWLSVDWLVVGWLVGYHKWP